MIIWSFLVTAWNHNIEIVTGSKPCICCLVNFPQEPQVSHSVCTIKAMIGWGTSPKGQFSVCHIQADHSAIIYGIYRHCYSFDLRGQKATNIVRFCIIIDKIFSKIIMTHFSKGESNRGSSPTRLQRDITCNKISINLSRCYIERSIKSLYMTVENE